MPIEFEKPKRRVTFVALHHSASDVPAHDDVSVIDDWHRGKGWNGVGYHYFLPKAGGVQLGRPLHRTPASIQGHNTGSIAICLSGSEHFTGIQLTNLRNLCEIINKSYDGKITFHGHKEFAATLCPAYDYRTLLSLNASGRMTNRIALAPVPESDDWLERGDRGESVRALQADLNFVGGYGLDEDGIFGPATERALRGFQSVDDILVTGVLDPKTREALDIEIKEGSL